MRAAVADGEIQTQKFWIFMEWELAGRRCSEYGNGIIHGGGIWRQKNSTGLEGKA